MANNKEFSADAVLKKVKSAITMYGQASALKLEGYAKQNAPWVDRTTNARNSIRGQFDWDDKDAVITLSGNMEYSVWLELANEKKYAILRPTIDKHSDEIRRNYREIIK